MQAHRKRGGAGSRIRGTAGAAVLALVWLATGSADVVRGQAGAAEAEVLGVLETVFDGMRRADSAMVRTGFAEGARFAMLPPAEDGGRVRYSGIEGWLSGIDGSGGSWDERIYDVEVLVQGDMAVAWAPYTFYLDGAVRHCGINSAMLLRTAGGWKITQLSDTRRTEGCPDPLAAGASP